MKLECEYEIIVSSFEPEILNVIIEGPRAPYDFSHRFVVVENQVVLRLTPLSVMEGEGVETFVLSNLHQSKITDTFSNPIDNDSTSVRSVLPIEYISAKEKSIAFLSTLISYLALVMGLVMNFLFPYLTGGKLE